MISASLPDRNASRASPQDDLGVAGAGTAPPSVADRDPISDEMNGVEAGFVNRDHLPSNEEGDDDDDEVADEIVPVPTDAVFDDSPVW